MFTHILVALDGSELAASVRLAVPVLGLITNSSGVSGTPLCP